MRQVVGKLESSSPPRAQVGPFAMVATESSRMDE
jgi:hypothetical protein